MARVTLVQARERVERELAEQLQQVIRRHIARQHYTVNELARLLDVMPQTVNSMMQRPRWDFGLCLSIIGSLDIPVRVTGRKG